MVSARSCRPARPHGGEQVEGPRGVGQRSDGVYDRPDSTSLTLEHVLRRGYDDDAVFALGLDLVLEALPRMLE